MPARKLISLDRLKIPVARAESAARSWTQRFPQGESQGWNLSDVTGTEAEAIHTVIEAEKRDAHVVELPDYTPRSLAHATRILTRHLDSHPGAIFWAHDDILRSPRLEHFFYPLERQKSVTRVSVVAPIIVQCPETISGPVLRLLNESSLRFSFLIPLANINILTDAAVQKAIQLLIAKRAEVEIWCGFQGEHSSPAILHDAARRVMALGAIPRCAVAIEKHPHSRARHASLRANVQNSAWLGARTCRNRGRLVSTWKLL